MSDTVKITLILSITIVIIAVFSLLYFSERENTQEDNLSRDYETAFNECIDDYDAGLRPLDHCWSILEQWERELGRELNSVLD